MKLPVKTPEAVPVTVHLGSLVRGVTMRVLNSARPGYASRIQEAASCFDIFAAIIIITANTVIKLVQNIVKTDVIPGLLPNVTRTYF